MTAESFENAEHLLRYAVTYRRFQEVDSRIHAYCEEADRQLQTLSAGDTRHKATLARVLETLEWTRLMLCAARTACAAKVERAALIDRYLGTQSSDPRPETHLDF